MDQFLLLLALEVLDDGLGIPHFYVVVFKPLENFVINSFFLAGIGVEGDGVAIGFVVLLVQDTGETNPDVAHLIFLQI